MILHICSVTIEEECTLLTAPDNGDVDCLLGEDGAPTNGDTCAFTCNDGYRLCGSNTRTCRVRRRDFMEL